jgi:hypothetical protein
MRIALGVLLFLAVGLTHAFAQTASLSSPPRTTAVSASEDAPVASAGPESGIDVGPLKNVKFSGLVQVWYQAGDQGFADTFRLRRIRLYLGGQIASRAKFLVMVDPARALAVNQQWTAVDGTKVLKDSSVDQATRMLADAYITLSVVPHLEVQAGQFKLPMNLEGSLPVQDLPLVDRSLMTADRSRGGVMGDIRDVGVMAHVSFANGLEFRAGAFNGLGSGQNDVDKDDGKALVGRVSYRTPLPGLQVGAFAATDRTALTDTERRRLGVDLRYVRGRLLLQGEIAGGRDGVLTRRGYYTLAAWRIRPEFEVAARFDVWDPDLAANLSRTDVVERDYTSGLSYYISARTVKCQAEYIRKTYRDFVPSQNIFLTNLQLAW